MIKNKEQYCSPTTNILVVRIEGRILDGSPWGDPNQAGKLGDEENDRMYSF